MSNEIVFTPDVAMESATRADFTYKITPNTIAITDTTLGKLSVTKDIDAVLRKIEYWHQGSMATHLRLTQSAISKLEAGRDEDLTIRDRNRRGANAVSRAEV